MFKNFCLKLCFHIVLFTLKIGCAQIIFTISFVGVSNCSFMKNIAFDDNKCELPRDLALLIPS